MKTVIHSGRVVTGDERTVIDGGAVVLDGDRIAGVHARSPEISEDAFTAIDASGCVVLPGLINCHAHGVSPGPLFPSAAPEDERWRENLDRHLAYGTTTVLSLCGFATIEEIEAADRAHPVNVRGATNHLPSALEAARAADGTGLRPAHERPTVESMLSAGAVAIGELGAGHTLGGGGQDARYIPRAVAERTGVRIDSHQARALKEAALGRNLCARALDGPAMDAALGAAGLTGLLSPAAARDLVEACVMPSVVPALRSFGEGAALSAELGVPALLHSASVTGETMREVARRHAPRGAVLIACHSNHPSFTPGEAIALARELSEAGVVIEMSTFDLLVERTLVRTREHWDRLAAEPGVVDVLATDYGPDGRHDPLIAAVADLVARGHASLPVAVAMASSRVARAIPGLALGRGALAAGRVADVVVAREDDLSDVRHVIVAGRHVIRDGVRVADAERTVSPVRLGGTGFTVLELAAAADLPLLAEDVPPLEDAFARHREAMRAVRAVETDERDEPAGPDPRWT